jgi:hypothetical protein
MPSQVSTAVETSTTLQPLHLLPLLELSQEVPLQVQLVPEDEEDPLIPVQTDIATSTGCPLLQV